MLSYLMAACLVPWGAAYSGSIQPCNIELTDGVIFIGSPFLPAAIALKAAEHKDPRVAHPDASRWEWVYRAQTYELLPAREDGKPKATSAQCRALDPQGRRAWVAEGGEDVPAATLVCTLSAKFKNGGHALLIALNADLEVLAAKQLWRDEEGTVLCHLPRKPPA